MGYSTKYNLEIINDNDDCDVFWEDIENHDDLYYAVGSDGKSGNDCKWYDHEKDMVEISKSYPLLTFKLNGEGEESGDIWVKYFRNGKKQIKEAEIIIPEFSENDWV